LFLGQPPTRCAIKAPIGGAWVGRNQPTCSPGGVVRAVSPGASVGGTSETGRYVANRPLCFLRVDGNPRSGAHSAAERVPLPRRHRGCARRHSEPVSRSQRRTVLSSEPVTR
jgi:hypothetical protein